MGNGNSVQPNCKQPKDPKKRSESTDERPGRSKRSDKDDRCRCSLRKTKRSHRVTNPFIVFYLRLRQKKPRKPVTELARAAGKLWSRMSIEQRQKYIDLANAEKRRRGEKKRRRQKCKRST